MEFAKQETRLVAGYSDVTGEYETRPLEGEVLGQPTILPISPLNETSLITDSAQNQHLLQAQFRNNPPTVEASLLNGFKSCAGSNKNSVDNNLNSERASCLSNSLLGAALFTSVLNTLLLSFVVKTIELNDRGILDGKISWDQESKSSLFELPVRMEDKSILLASIVSHDDKPLRFELGQDKMRAPTSSSSASSNSITFLRSNSNGQQATVQSQQQTPDDSYLANDPNDHKLVMGTRKLVMSSSSSNVGESMNRSSKVEGEKKILLVANGDLESVELPQESELKFDSPTASSLTCESQFKSPQITGSLEENFDLQARDGNLACESDGAMKLVAKSASIKLTSFHQLLLNSPELKMMAAKHLYIPHAGLHYFDSDEQRQFKQSHKPETLAKASRQSEPAAAAGAGASEPPLWTDERRQTDVGNNNNNNAVRLRAYNLVAVDGLLMAGSS